MLIRIQSPSEDSPVYVVAEEISLITKGRLMLKNSRVVSLTDGDELRLVELLRKHGIHKVVELGEAIDV